MADPKLAPHLNVGTRNDNEELILILRFRSVAVLAIGLLGASLSCLASAESVIPAGHSMNLPGVGMNMGCADLRVDGTLNFASGQIDQAGALAIGPTGAIAATAGTIVIGGNWNNQGTFSAGTTTVVLDDTCSTGPVQLIGKTTFHNLTLRTNSGKQFSVPPDAQLLVTGTLTLQGIPGKPLQLFTPSGQPPTIFLAPGATLNQSNVEVRSSGGAEVAAIEVPTLDRLALTTLAGLILVLAAARNGQGRTRQSQ